MMNSNQISTLLGVCIVPAIITQIKGLYGDQEESAIRNFYKSHLFEKLQNPDTGLWHLSSSTLSEIFLNETIERKVDFPEEQS
ncbi:MAG: hypothetical protein LBC84_04500 [Prevotellaceae bacterium]|jgi:hypothetical protein|nr:hypothetical protein [Prevotellaceae bacterium]